MKILHTADWHLGKWVQGVSMTEDQRHVMQQLIELIKTEKPDVVVVAGDLYDRAVPAMDAVQLLNEVLETIVLQLKTPVVAIAGNHDSPARLDFGSRIMESNGLYIVGQWSPEQEPVILSDEEGEVHFHLVPYAEPGMIRHLFEEEDIRSHNDAMNRMTDWLRGKMDQNARHILVGHAFVTPMGEQRDNTSDSERPLSIGGAEHVDHRHFEPFHYVALGHLHQAHFVGHEKIRYSGSPLKYSVSEENHKKGCLVVELDGKGNVEVDKKLFIPKRDLRTIEATMSEIESHKLNDDYVFVRLLDKTPVLAPMEKIRSVYPNAMHVERKTVSFLNEGKVSGEERKKMDTPALFKAFYQEVNGNALTKEKEELFSKALEELRRAEGERL